jgi:multicomponent Na+:H+ antiporter subunit D
MFGTLPPGLILILGGLALTLVPAKLRGWAFLVPPVLALLHLGGLEPGTTATWSFATYELIPLHVDELAMVFGWIFALVALLAGVYALHLKDTGQQVSALLYAGSGLGAVFAGDLFTLMVFWEIMAFASAYLVWARRTPEAYASAMRYLFVHLFGGSLLLGGILWHIADTGSIAFTAFEPSAASWLILGGFAVNAAVVPFHAWIADAYPRGTITGSVFLSAFTTKTAVYTMARGFAGWEILVFAGVLMAIWGVLYAILANDIRRVLAYHIVSQVGFMVAGIGVGTAMAINGATAHAYTHILYKGLLFMATGAVIYATGRSRMTELGGLFRATPALFWFYMVAALSISSAPFFSGFVSKPMTIAAVEYADYTAAVLFLHLASVGTFLSVGLKLPYFTWFGREPAEPIEVKPIPWNIYAAMGAGAALNILLGVWPAPLYAILPGGPVDFDPYALTYFKKAVQLLLFTAIVFFAIASLLKPKATIQLDTDWLYRRAAAPAWNFFVAPVERFFAWGERASWQFASIVARAGVDPVSWFRTRWRTLPPGEVSAPGETPSTVFRVSMTTMMALLLASVVLLMLIVLVRTLG